MDGLEFRMGSIAAFKNQNSDEHNLVSDKDVGLIKVKLGKQHIKESDWTVIKDILSSHNVIVMEPVKEDPRLPVKDHILCEEGTLVVFTNMEDCHEHILYLNQRDHMPARLFRLGSLPFEIAVGAAEKYQMDLYIDLLVKENNMCMVYLPKTKMIYAVTLSKA